MSTPPRFVPHQGSPESRISVVEGYLARNEEYLKQRDEAVGRGIDALDARVSKLEAWKSDVLIFIGATKIKWGWVTLATSLVAAAVTAAVLKVLHLA